MDSARRIRSVREEPEINPLLQELFTSLPEQQPPGQRRNDRNPDQPGSDRRPEVVRDGNDRITRITSGEGRTVYFEYDNNGRMTEYRVYKDARMTQLEERWTTSDQRLWVRRDSNGRNLEEWRGRVSVPLGRDNEPIIRWEHLDENNRVTRTSNRYVDGTRDVAYADRSRVRFNNRGQVVEVVTPGGDRSTIDYNRDGNPSRVSTSRGTYESTDGNIWRLVRGTGRVGAPEVMEGAFIVRPSGDISFRDNTGRLETFSRTGRLTQTDTRVTYHVDQLGRIVGVVRRDGTMTVFRYQENNRQPIAVTHNGVELHREPGTDHWYAGRVFRGERRASGVIGVDQLGRVTLNNEVQDSLFRSGPERENR